MIHTSLQTIAMPNTSNPQNSPVQVAIRHNLSIELHGDNFSIVKKLTIDEALGLIGMLTYVTREHLYKSQTPAQAVKS